MLISAFPTILAAFDDGYQPASCLCFALPRVHTQSPWQPVGVVDSSEGEDKGMKFHTLGAAASMGERASSLGICKL